MMCQQQQGIRSLSSSKGGGDTGVEQTLREAQEYVDAPRTSVRESRHHKDFPVTWLL
jgi:hypothetical protein